MKPNLFNSVKVAAPQTNVFDLSHDVKMSAKMGNLYPIMRTSCVPGDRFKIGCESLIRFAPLVSPAMHRFDVTMHYFFIPYRILWPNWENFITNTKNEGGFLPAAPYIKYTKDVWNLGLSDYLGLPEPPAGLSENVLAYDFAAYQCIYNEYYRDQNLIEPVDYILKDGENPQDLGKLRKRAWEHDYFTSCLPWAQKGDAVNLPIGQFNDVPVRVNEAVPGTPVSVSGSVTMNTETEQYNGDWTSFPIDGLFAKTSDLQAQSTTINDLRRAFRLQEWLERAARGGTRYVELIKSFFGVNSPDKRLQRPEYITGIKTPVVISEVLQTSETATSPQGNMAGHGVSVVAGGDSDYYCEEHGVIMGIMSVMPKTAYQQGIHRTFLKFDPLDYYWEQFANIGEQEVFNKELYAFTANGNNTFGYIPRYSEYKFENNRVAGEFRNSLDFWHEGRIFATEPALNEEFISCNPANRIFAVTDPEVDNLYCHILNKVEAIRPMPVYGTPTF